jgi:hypothetical protein
MNEGMGEWMDEWNNYFFEFSEMWNPRWNDIDRGIPKDSGGKTCPSATLSTTNPTGLTRAAAVRGRRLTAWAMARPGTATPQNKLHFQVGEKDQLF